MSIIGWLIIGLLAGALARLLVPGRDPMSWVGTLLLGLAGAVVGGFLADVVFDDESIGLFGSVVGGMIVLVGYRALSRSERVT